MAVWVARVVRNLCRFGPVQRSQLDDNSYRPDGRTFGKRRDSFPHCRVERDISKNNSGQKHGTRKRPAPMIGLQPQRKLREEEPFRTAAIFSPYPLRGPQEGFSKNGSHSGPFPCQNSPGRQGTRRVSLGGCPVLPENKKRSGTEKKRADARHSSTISSRKARSEFCQNPEMLGRPQRGGAKDAPSRAALRPCWTMKRSRQ
jgi:hypothetical protein